MSSGSACVEALLSNKKRNIIIILGFLFVLCVGLLVLGIVLADGPDYSMLDFQVDSVSMNVYNISNDSNSTVRHEKHITADLDFNLTLRKKKFYRRGLMFFSPMKVSLEYHHDEVLSSTTLESLNLVEDQRRLQFGMQIRDDDARPQNGTAAESISRDVWRQNAVQLALKAEGHYAVWDLSDFQKCGINVICDDIKVGFLPANNLRTGSMIVSPISCDCKSDCDLV